MQKGTEKFHKTYLPLFSGFNNTLFEFNHNELEGSIHEDAEIDYAGYESDVAKAFCKSLADKFDDLIESIEFESIQSPNFYNFTNDSVNCKIKLKSIQDFSEYLHSNYDELNDYVKDHYTSRDGFISFHPNKAYDWSVNTGGFKNWNNDPFHLGAMLDFYFSNEGKDEIDIYYDVMEGIYALNYVKDESSTLQ